jgi:heptosyltransferase-1
MPKSSLQRLLVVKTSSMGDVVHALPAVTDMLAHNPGLEVDWLVEKPFAAIAALHPGVHTVWPMSWRKWRRSLGQRATWRAMGELRDALVSRRYDLVLDLQGLLKSAIWARQAGAPCAGYDWASAREPLASLLYPRRAAVSPQLHAIERCRQLAAAHLGYSPPSGPAAFGLRPPEPVWPAPAQRAVLIPCASRPEKFWPNEHWRAVLRRCEAQGLTPVVLWGSELEHANAQIIAQGSSAVVPPFLTVADTAAVLSGAALVVGLDTGFTHLAAAFGCPTIGIYCDHEPGLTGVTGPGWVRSFGGKGWKPPLADVMGAVESALA